MVLVMQGAAYAILQRTWQAAAHNTQRGVMSKDEMVVVEAMHGAAHAPHSTRHPPEHLAGGTARVNQSH
jgi:hypothetical protein